MALTCCDAMCADGVQHSDFAWDLHCAAAVAVAASIVMADIARQVEVGCAERGRALTQAWNVYAQATAAATGGSLHVKTACSSWPPTSRCLTAPKEGVATLHARCKHNSSSCTATLASLTWDQRVAAVNCFSSVSNKTASACRPP